MDHGTIKFVLGLLGAICGLSIAGAVVLSLQGKDPSFLATIAANCTGAIIGILVTPRAPAVTPPVSSAPPPNP